MNNLERNRHLLYSIYEGGIPLDEALKELTGVSNSSLDRIKAREIIEWFMDRNYNKVNDGEHYLLVIPAIMVNNLINHLETAAKGGKVNMYDEGPSVW